MGRKTSIFHTLREKMSSRPRARQHAAAERATGRTSRKDSQSPNGTSHWNRNPFADPVAPAPRPEPAVPAADEAPPAYAPSDPSPSAHLSAATAVPQQRRRGASPSPSLASVTTREDKYAFLTTFDTAFVIDDSGSMAGRSWREVREALAAITPICTSHDADGIDVHFLNHNAGPAAGGYANVRDAAEVQALFESVRPSGATPTGASLQKILKPYVDSLQRHRNQMERVRPVNIIVITDGCPTDDPESIIVQFARKLDSLEAPPHQVGIQFFQVGNEPGASRALRELDDDLSSQGIRDMVDTVTWDTTSSSSTKELTADGILKVVLGAVVRRLDRQVVGGGSRRGS